jgi:peptidoglycan/LPS O-acetylase OafA/YrhL
MKSSTLCADNVKGEALAVIPTCVRDVDRAAPSQAFQGRNQRRADIQGLRALAVILVVAFHAGLPLPGGFVGVDVFFVISGYVITGMLVRELEASGGLGLRDFYARRARRLLPALALVIVVVTVVSTLVLSPLNGSQQATASTGQAAPILSANVELWTAPAGYFDHSVNPLLHLWSLSVEEQFYLLFPALLLLAWRRSARAKKRRMARTMARWMGMLFGGSFVLSLWLTHVNPKLAFYASPTRAWEFAAGALAAMAMPAAVRLGRRGAQAAGAVGIVLIALAARTYSGATSFPGWAAVLPVAGTAMVLLAGVAATRGVTALLATRPAVCLGDLSYGWYLWHWPAVVFARILWPSSGWVLPVAGLASLLPTWLSHRLVEEPFRRNAGLRGRRLFRLVAVCLVLPIVCSLGLSLTAAGALATSAVGAIKAQLALHADETHGCVGFQPDKLTKPSCTWSVHNPRGTVVLAGDSNAGQFTEPVARAANTLGLNMTVATASNCPLSDIAIKAPPGSFSPPGCHAYVTGLLAQLARMHPSLVVIGSAAASYVNGPWQLGPADGGRLVSDPAAKAAVWEQGLASVLGALRGAGIPVLVVHTIPYVGTDVGLCPAFRLYIDAAACGVTASRIQIDAGHALAAAAEEQAIAASTGVRGVDFTGDLCSATACSTKRGSLWLYRDSNHLSIGGALSLTGHFKQLLRLST